MPDRSDLEDGECPYRWVDRDNPSVLEVRPLRYRESVGDESNNLLIRGDSLEALKALRADPEWSKKFAGKVKLAYIDPPFNTGQAFEQYDDALDHSVWLSMISERLRLMFELLSPDGTLWLHVDDIEVHRARLILDEVAGASSFAGHVIWRSSDNSNNDAKTFSNDLNHLLVYRRSERWKSNLEQATLDRLPHYKNPDSHPDGPYFDGNPLNSPSPRENLMYDLEAPDGSRVAPPPNGWRWERPTMQTKMATGEIYWREDLSGIRRRTFLKDHAGLPPSNLWSDLEITAHNRRAKSELSKLFPSLPTSKLFSTPKPEQLMQRVVSIATDPGDIVLDCFAGSGTTAAVAHKMGRGWVTIERETVTVEAFTQPRLEMVVKGQDPGGITSVERRTFVGDLPAGVEPDEAKKAARVLKAMFEDGRLDGPLRKVFSGLDGGAFDKESAKFIKALNKEVRKGDKIVKHVDVLWEGGGGFQVLDVADPIWELDEDGDPVLRDGVTSPMFAESVRVQLGFKRLVGRKAFSGGRGRQLLAAEFAGRLAEDERVLIVGTAVTPEARVLLRELSPGSKLIKAPSDLFAKFGRVIR